jgi:hypothetical protein
MVNKDNKLNFRFKFETLEDGDIFLSLADIFDAITTFIDPKDNSCDIYIDLSKYKKTTTYIFQYGMEFYKEWLSDKLHMFISRARNEGMDRIRFITLLDSTRKEIEEELIRQDINCLSRNFLIEYDTEKKRTVLVYSFLCE